MFPPEYWSQTKKLMLLGAMAGGKLVEAAETGNPLTFVTEKAKPLRSLLIPFTPVQSGTGDPSPENVRPIAGWTGVAVNHTGKNLLNPNLDDWSMRLTTYYYINGVVPEGATARFTLEEKDSTVDISGCYLGFVSENLAESAPVNYRWVVENGNVISNMSNISRGSINVLCSNVFIYPATAETVQKLFGRFNIMVELGSDATAYEPYIEPTVYPVVFPALGKNLLNPAFKTTPSRHIYFYKADGFYLSAGTYTLSCASQVAGILVHNMDNSEIGHKYNATSYTFTLDEGKTVYFNFYDNDIDLDMNCQLETGETATSYAPFDNTIYGGTLDVVSGELWKTWELVDMGSLVWAYAQTTNFRMFYASVGNAKSDTELFCEQYEKQNGNDANNTIRKYITGSGVVRVSVHDDRYNEYTEQQFKTAMDGVEIATTLATPVLVATLTPQQITALIGNNTIWSDTNGENTVVYLKKG